MTLEELSKELGDGKHQFKAHIQIQGSKIHIILVDEQGGKLEIKQDFSTVFAKYLEYVVETSAQNDTGLKEMDLLQWSSGASEEANEVLAMARKAVFHKTSVDQVDVVTELGDLLYYFIATLNNMGTTIEEVAQANMIKLNSRFPEGRRDLAFKDKKLEYKLIKEHLDKNDST